MSEYARDSAQYILRLCSRITNSIQRGYTVIRQNKRPFWILQVGYWTTYAIATGLALRFPHLQDAALADTNRQLEEYQMGRSVVGAYESKQLLKSASYTFGINLLVGAFGTITLPSALVPFSGIGLAIYRAALWGLIFAPNESKSITFPHLVTMLIEGQAYIIASLGGLIQGRGFLDNLNTSNKEGEGEEKSRVGWKGYKTGWKRTLDLYGPISIILLISAVWEAYEVIHLPGKKL